jgi:lipopolysaccharide/colanic/teichoic acid biosynthesis glycosyltransferase
MNVIKGDMNLVGNAPLTREEVDSLKEEWETIRFQAPAGLFHLWEITGDKDSTWEEKVITDNYYATTRTFWGDIKILVKSFPPGHRR